MKRGGGSATLVHPQKFSLVPGAKQPLTGPPKEHKLKGDLCRCHFCTGVGGIFQNSKSFSDRILSPFNRYPLAMAPAQNVGVLAALHRFQKTCCWAPIRKTLLARKLDRRMI